MSSGASGSDEQISGSKVEPLASNAKEGVPLDTSSRGSVGTDRSIGESPGHLHRSITQLTRIDQARIDPVGGAGKLKFLNLIQAARRTTSGCPNFSDLTVDNRAV